MQLPLHEQFLAQAKAKLSQDHRLLGLLAGGSMMTGTMDEYSDLDLVIVYDAAYLSSIMEERIQIAEGLGHLLSAFTGEHVGEPRLVICLYGPQPLHVDLKFITSAELTTRIENPLIIWERAGEISSILQATSPSYPTPDPQWMEDRFWVWIHYGAAKLGRGEIFEAIDLITFIRGTVLGPLILMQKGHLPRGVRRLEEHAENELEELKRTLPVHDANSCYHALKTTIRMYKRLRPASDTFIARSEAEQISISYLEHIYDTIIKNS